MEHTEHFCFRSLCLGLPESGLKQQYIVITVIIIKMATSELPLHLGEKVVVWGSQICIPGWQPSQLWTYGLECFLGGRTHHRFDFPARKDLDSEEWCTAGEISWERLSFERLCQNHFFTWAHSCEIPSCAAMYCVIHWSVKIMSWIMSMVSCLVTVTGLQGLGSSSRLSLHIWIQLPTSSPCYKKGPPFLVLPPCHCGPPWLISPWDRGSGWLYNVFSNVFQLPVWLHATRAV